MGIEEISALAAVDLDEKYYESCRIGKRSKEMEISSLLARI